MPSPPGRFTSGVTTVPKQNPLGMFGMPDPSKWNVFWNDFHYFNAVLAAATTASDWTATTTNTTLATIIGIDGDGGIASITNTAADNDAAFLQWRGGLIAAAGVQECFRFVAGKRAFFKSRWQVSDITQSDVFVGLMITTADPEAGVTDGVYFRKSDGATDLHLVVEKDSAEVTVSTGAAASGAFAANTYLTTSFAYDGRGNFGVYVNDIQVGSAASGVSFPDDEDLAVTFGIKNGEAVAKVMLMDYIFAATER